MKQSVTARLKPHGVLVAAIAIFALSIGYGLRNSRASPPSKSGERSSKSISSPPPRSETSRATEVTPKTRRNPSTASIGKDEMTQKFEAALRSMQQGRQEDIDLLLEQLDAKLASNQGDPGPGIAAILEFLKTGKDAPTGQGFIIGEKGALTQATTLRVYLMNKLGILSRETDGTSALGVAREVLGSFGSADEWAVSMRNVAWFEPENREFLQNRVSAMLSHPAWREAPSAGMLEAFDVIVHSAAMTMVPDLSQLSTIQGTPLARASSVALDRLASQETVAFTKLLNQQPKLFSETPLLRADLYGHANLEVAEQREQLEQYLLRPDVNAQERAKFLASLIQSGRFVSHNLITPLVPPESPPQARERLQTLMQTVGIWKADARFQGLIDELNSVELKARQILTEIAAEGSD
jgi:hypothetical protein